jgi:hypothetical protein
VADGVVLIMVVCVAVGVGFVLTVVVGVAVGVGFVLTVVVGVAVGVVAVVNVGFDKFGFVMLPGKRSFFDSATSRPLFNAVPAIVTICAVFRITYSHIENPNNQRIIIFSITILNNIALFLFYIFSSFSFLYLPSFIICVPFFLYFCCIRYSSSQSRCKCHPVINQSLVVRPVTGSRCHPVIRSS